MGWLQYQDLIERATTSKNDVYPLLENPHAFRQVIQDLTKLIENLSFDKVAGLEATGMVFGAALAHHTNKGFIAIRRSGKWPYRETELLSQTCTDYSNTQKRFVLRKNQVSPPEDILVFDDWLETGAQFQTATKLLTKAGANVVAGTFLAVDKNEATRPILQKHDIRCLRPIQGE